MGAKFSTLEKLEEKIVIRDGYYYYYFFFSGWKGGGYCL